MCVPIIEVLYNSAIMRVFKPSLVSDGIPGRRACATVQDHMQAMCAVSAASQFSFL